MPRGVPRQQPAPVTVTTTHPLAMELARELAAGDPDRPVVPVNAHTALICNRRGLLPPEPPQAEPKPPTRRKRRTT